ncbi:hypothetical protein BH11MYX1_BH11MYX1_41480 [soil metagenome]
MADVVGIRVKCPECGASLRASAEVVTCSYCGTEARVQRRTQLLQRPIDLPPVAAWQPQQVALQRRSSSRTWIAVVALVAVTTFVPVILSAALGKGGGFIKVRSVPTQPTELWDTPHPVLVDLDGDGLEDAIGIMRYVGARDEMHLRAVSGATGKVLWEAPSLGTYMDVYQAKLALAEGVVLFGETDRKPRLEAYDAKAGTKRWSIAPPEVVKDLCRDRAGFVKLVTKDEVETLIELATGAGTAVVRKAPCIALPSSDRQQDPLFDTNNRHWGFGPPGMQSYQILGDPSSWILSGAKAPGTAIPMIAVIDDQERVIWKAQLASSDPMSSQRLVDQIVAFDATVVATAYRRTDDKLPPVIVAFERATGNRLFETPLKGASSETIAGVSLELGPTTVWIQLGNGLRAYDRKTGVLRWQI